MTITFQRLFFTFSVLIICLSFSAYSFAAPRTKGFTSIEPHIKLAPDQSKLIRLNENAASIIISSPVHANIILDNPRLLIIIPGIPGTTSFTVLNANGDIITKRQVIVTGRSKKYVRIRRSCASGDTACVPENYYYCPNGCHPVSIKDPDAMTAATAVPEFTSGTAAPSSAAEERE